MAKSRVRTMAEPAMLDLHETREGEYLRLALTGELDFSNVERFRARLHELSEAHAAVRLDLSELEFMDSTGVHAIIDALHESRRNGWMLDVAAERSPQVDRLFKLVQMDSYFGAQEPH